MTSFLLAIIYLAFISLGLPDSLLGAAWPVMYQEMEAPVSYAGIISMIIALGTVISSLMGDRMARWFGAAKVTAVSVGVTAVALFGFSISGRFWMLCLWAIPYGLGAGAVDAALNNYVALHFASRHMSWLHCMWGVGAATGPYIMGYAISAGQGWSAGYRYIAIFQVALTAVLFLSLSLWKSAPGGQEEDSGEQKPLKLREIVRIPGTKAVMLTFFGYSAIEQTTNLWASSYLVLEKGVPTETAAFFASMFFIGLTVGRGISGFLTMKLNDVQMVRLGLGIIAVGVAAMLLPLGEAVSLAGLILIGLGCAPIYPSLIHATPANFGAGRSQAVIGVQMASAYTGTCLLPALFGLIADHISLSLLPVYLLAFLALITTAHEMLQKRVAAAKN